VLGRTAVLAVSAFLALAPAAQADQSQCLLPGVWCGDFGLGFVGWDGFDGNVASPGARQRYFGIGTAPSQVPVGASYFAARVDAGATPRDGEGQRSVVYLFPDRDPTKAKTQAFEGAEQWYHTSIEFPWPFRSSPQTAWNWVAEWHNWPNSVCCANLALTVDTTSRHGPRRGRGLRRETLSLRVMGGGDPRHPVDVYGGNAADDPRVRTRWFVGDGVLDRGHWYDVLLHVRWSHRASVGLVEWWLDGRRVTSVSTPTLFWYRDNLEGDRVLTPGPGQAYWMLGYYRSRLRDGRLDRRSATVMHAGPRRGPTPESVAY
jgi:polysaccharide lyase-like protein